MPVTFDQVSFSELYRSKGGFEDSHEADALYFCCCDFRFRKKTNEYMDALPGNKLDLFSWAGGVMPFVGAKYGHVDMSAGALYYAKLLAKAHHVKRIYVEVHGKDLGKCGAYALAPLIKDKSAEAIFELQLNDAFEVKELLEQETGLPVTLVYKRAAEDGSEDIIFEEMNLKAAPVANPEEELVAA